MEDGLNRGAKSKPKGASKGPRKAIGWYYEVIGSDEDEAEKDDTPTPASPAAAASEQFPAEATVVPTPKPEPPLREDTDTFREADYYPPTDIEVHEMDGAWRPARAFVHRGNSNVVVYGI